MKRSHRVALVLLGSASGGVFSGCSQQAAHVPVRISSQCVYVNDFFVPGVGYYHAPFRRFFAFPYNYYDKSRGTYFYGGNWGAKPFESIINISSPSDDVATRAEAMRTDVVRGGFGGTGGWYSSWGG